MEEEKVNYLFGMHPVFEAVAADKKIEKVLFSNGLEGDQFRDLLELLQQKNIPIQFAPVERLNRITVSRHQGVIAFMPQIEYVTLEEAVENSLAKSKTPLILLLDGVSDVRNFGAIARCAECSGVDAIILPAKGGASINADAIKTSAGALLIMPTCKVPNLRTAIFYLQESGFQVVAATEKADKYIYDIDFKQPTAVIMGSENRGISPAILALTEDQAKIPMKGAIGSLNVSAAAAVVLYEAVRQRL